MQLRISQPFCYGYKYIRIKEAIAVKNRNEKERSEDRSASLISFTIYNAKKEGMSSFERGDVFLYFLHHFSLEMPVQSQYSILRFDSLNAKMS